jgi:hypothetical protein
MQVGWQVVDLVDKEGETNHTKMEAKTVPRMIRKLS